MSAIANANKVPSISVIGIKETDPVPDYLVKYRLDGTDSALTRTGGDDYRIGKACPDAIGSWFDGSTQYFTGNDSNILNDGTSFTISLWFNALDNGLAGDLIYLGDNLGGIGGGIRLSKSSSGSIFLEGSGQTVSSVSTSSNTDGNWHNLVIVYDGANVSSYIDSVLELSPTPTIDRPIDSNDVTIGTQFGAGGRFFDGGLDDIRLYDRVLTTDEITILYNYQCDFNPSQMSIRAWYDAQDQTTITESLGLVSQWDDKSVNTENISQGTGANQPTTLLNNLNGMNVITYNGAHSLVALNAIKWTENFHVFVVSRRTLLNNSTLMGSFNALDGDWRIAPSTSTDSRAQVREGGSSRTQSSSGTDIVNYFINELEFSNNTLYSVKDGVRSEGLSVTYPNITTAEFLTIGARSSGGNFFTGDIAEIVIVQGVLTQDNIDSYQGYLAWKWFNTSSLGTGNPNLPMGHPYKYQPPKSKPTQWIDTLEWEDSEDWTD